MKKIDLTGEKYHRLLVLKAADRESNRSVWLCQCDCGEVKEVAGHQLRSGHVKSCGCLNNEKRAERALLMAATNTKNIPSITSARRIWKLHQYNDELTFEEFYTLSQSNCFYCGTSPSNQANPAKFDRGASDYARENGTFIYNGLDRVNNSLPHIKDNVVPCCKYCNYAKRERTTQQFVEWINNLYLNLPAIQEVI